MPGRAEETAQEESRQQEPLQIWRQGDAGESELLFKCQQTKLTFEYFLFWWTSYMENENLNTNGDFFSKDLNIYLNLYHMTFEILKYNKLVASTTYVYDTFLVLSILFEA